MHDSERTVNVGKKAAQVGFTEAVLNRVFYNLDVRGLDCLYVLPAQTPDAGEFSTARVDTAIELSSYLQNLFSDIKNVGHKKAGNSNLYIRGGRSRSGLKSIPVGCLIMDEVEEIPEKNISLARERTSGQLVTDTWLISTPSIPEHGIAKIFENSTQNHFFFRCPSCSKFIELKWPDSFVVVGEHGEDPRISESHHICYECKNKLDNAAKIEFLADGIWVPSFDDKDDAGWYINQLYSMTEKAQPKEFAKSFLNAMANPFDEQEFYNSKVGVEHVVEGSSVTDSDFRNCTSEMFRMFEDYSGPNLTTMGIDVGRWIHYEIAEWKIGQYVGSDVNLNSLSRILRVGKVLSFEELDSLMLQYNITYAVIDKFPESRKSLEFAMRFFGRVRLCVYAQGIAGKFIHDAENEVTLNVDRTTWLDLSLSRFKTRKTVVPVDIPMEYKDQVKALIRVYDKDKNGNPLAKYVNPKPDHYGHAHNYAEIALPMAMKITTGHQNIGSFL